MASLFRNLFGHKKSHSRGEDDNGNNEAPLERDQSRRSHRPSSKSRGAAARFQDDSMLPPTAAYHSQNAKKLPRGPKSCPGEYVEDSGTSSSRHFAIDYNRHEPPKEHRRRSGQLASSSSMMTSTSSSHYRPHNSQRWETSEYGSENTSPIGYQRHQQQRRHQNRPNSEENEDDEEEDETEEELTYEKKYRYQEVKRKIRAHYEERLFNYERTQRNDHRQIKELEKEKDELLKMLLQSNAKLEKEKKKTEYFRRKWQESEQQTKMFPPSFAFQQTPQFQPMFPFGNTSGGAPAQRYSFMGAPMHPISTSNTPTTSAMDTTHGGAGESLVPASDVSFLTPLNVSSTLHELPPSVPTSSANHPTASTSFYHDDDEDQDETKNFRDIDDMEIPRGSSNTLMNDEDFMNNSTVSTLQEEGKDSGFSTTPDDVKKEMEQLEVK